MNVSAPNILDHELKQSKIRHFPNRLCLERLLEFGMKVKMLQLKQQDSPARYDMGAKHQ